MVFASILKHVTDEFTHGIPMGRKWSAQKPLMQEGLVTDTLVGHPP